MWRHCKGSLMQCHRTKWWHSWRHQMPGSCFPVSEPLLPPCIQYNRLLKLHTFRSRPCGLWMTDQACFFQEGKSQGIVCHRPHFPGCCLTLEVIGLETFVGVATYLRRTVFSSIVLFQSCKRAQTLECPGAAQIQSSAKVTRRY